MPLIKDGDLLLLIKDMLDKRGLQSTRITQVKGHPDDELVRIGAVEQVNKYVNDQADSAADLGRRYVLSLTMMTKVVLHLIQWFGLLAACPKNAKLKGLLETLLGFPGLIVFGLEDDICVTQRDLAFWPFGLLKLLISVWVGFLLSNS